jgi:hypothetical protein
MRAPETIGRSHVLTPPVIGRQNVENGGSAGVEPAAQER